LNVVEARRGEAEVAAALVAPSPAEQRQDAASVFKDIDESRDI
jgi:hypothetical protein